MDGRVIITSPNEGSVKERQTLAHRFSRRLSTNSFLSRQTVSYQGNRDTPGFRWMKYKEGFSSGLVEHMIKQEAPRSVLDPFAGICTTPLVAASRGCQATGIEIMPLGILAGEAIASAANGLSQETFNQTACDLMEAVRSQTSAPD